MTTTPTGDRLPPGRDGMPLNAVDRRAASLIQAGLQASFAKKGHKAPLNGEGKEDWSSLVAQVLADPVKGEKFRTLALSQFEAERKAAETAGDDLADLLPAPTKPVKATKTA